MLEKPPEFIFAIFFLQNFRKKLFDQVKKILNGLNFCFTSSHFAVNKMLTGQTDVIFISNLFLIEL